MTTSFWLRLPCLLGLWMLLVVTTFAPSTVFAYGRQSRVAFAYDQQGPSTIAYDNYTADVVFGYDGTNTRTENEDLREPVSFLTDLAGFLAAEAAPITNPARLLTAGTDVPNAGGVIRSFAQQGDQVYYRVFSGDKTVGSFLTAVPPRSSAWAQEALSLPPGNTAQYIQEVLVPNGTLLQRSRALAVPEWGRFGGGAEQFQLLEHIPIQNFGPGRALP